MTGVPLGTCEFLQCTLKGSASATDHVGRRWWLCRRHADILVRAVAGRFLVDTTERAGKGDRVQVRPPANYSVSDWAAHYRLLERPGHRIRANGAAFALDSAAAPIDVLICGCSWRGHYRMWPQHLRSLAIGMAAGPAESLRDRLGRQFG